MSLPPWAPWWIGALGGHLRHRRRPSRSSAALGQNLFNPAMVARVALLVSFPVAMTAVDLARIRCSRPARRALPTLSPSPSAAWSPIDA
ncbi:MAG: RnfABCDGE type electron transport complex subunit D [Chromatiales bacterium]|nr:RnfABCDGE type electron transport complex subunit D [Chromatiales bacterium]